MALVLTFTEILVRGWDVDVAALICAWGAAALMGVAPFRGIPLILGLVLLPAFISSDIIYAPAFAFIVLLWSEAARVGFAAPVVSTVLIGVSYLLADNGDSELFTDTQCQALAFALLSAAFLFTCFPRLTGKLADREHDHKEIHDHLGTPLSNISLLARGSC
ncbi:hypothetical protein [Corynebacterium yudongzhengii]|uniref:hypothetical protein n=1 Tax=Corynebacterium yudongzhengii TaxID=2080740 RepID=UPI0011B23751|nr:hypothetical protein [Corynebacterium yudongzhengii]